MAPDECVCESRTSKITHPPRDRRPATIPPAAQSGDAIVGDLDQHKPGGSGQNVCGPANRQMFGAGSLANFEGKEVSANEDSLRHQQGSCKQNSSHHVDGC
jgi:hypothetical protein